MAFNARKIYPLDTKPSVAIGIGLPFNGPVGFVSTYMTKDAIKANLINYFLTNKNERYLNVDFGANIRAFIFEQLTTGNTSFLKDDIQSKINQFFTNINVESLVITESPDTNELDIMLQYSVPNTNITDKLEITL
jgi:phage baseplate assembly protein W